MNRDKICVFPFFGNVPSSKDKLNNLHNEGEISLAHACNSVLGRPREALLTSSDWSCLRILPGVTRTSDNSGLTLKLSLGKYTAALLESGGAKTE